MTEKRKLTIKLVLMCLLLIVAGISIGVIIRDLWGERENRRKQTELQQLWYSSSSAPQEQQQGSEPDSTPAQREYANPQFAELLEINSDLVGWLEIGELSAPVVQNDSNDYYLKHDFYGNDDPHGTIYVDRRNDLEGGDDNLMLYGHNYNKSQQVFYEVERYKDAGYAAAHPIFSFTTLYEQHNYAVLGVFFANTVPEQGEVFDYHNRLSFESTKAMDEFISQVRSRSLIMTDLPADSYDSLITLSTCGYDFNGQRIVLVGRLIRPTETPEQLAAYSYGKNPAPIMPELWTQLYG